MELTVMILGFHMLNFKPAFSLSSFTLIKRLFSSSLSAFRVVSSAYMRLSIFLQTIFILACVSSNLAFCISAYKLNKQGESLDVWYRFLRRQVRWSDFPIPLRICHSIFLSFFFFFSFTQWNSVNNQWSRYFSGISAWSNRSWQFNLWFFCLF